MENFDPATSNMTRALVLFSMLLVGCESDEAKLQRLQQDASLARLTVLRYEQDLARAEEAAATPAQRDSVALLLYDARTKAALAERDLARFLR